MVVFIYSAEFEKLLKEEAEKCECMSIMHLTASSKLTFFSNIINMPVIALSSFIGFFTALQLFPEQNIVLGCLGIGVGMLKTIDSYFDFTKRAEQHRLVSLRYSKLSKLIQVQLSLSKNMRMDAKDFYYLIINDLANLKDSEPLIDDKIIREFADKYKKYDTAKPAICNGLTDIKIFANINIDADKKNNFIEMKNIFLNSKVEEKNIEVVDTHNEPNFECIDIQIEKNQSSTIFKNTD